MTAKAHREVAESVGDVNNYMKKVKEMEHELARIRGVHPVKDVSHLDRLQIHLLTCLVFSVSPFPQLKSSWRNKTNTLPS